LIFSEHYYYIIFKYLSLVNAPVGTVGKFNIHIIRIWVHNTAVNISEFWENRNTTDRKTDTGIKNSIFFKLFSYR